MCELCCVYVVWVCKLCCGCFVCVNCVVYVLCCFIVCVCGCCRDCQQREMDNVIRDGQLQERLYDASVEWTKKDKAV